MGPGEDCGTVIILPSGNITVTGGTSVGGDNATDIGGGKGSTNGDDGQGIKPTGNGNFTVYGDLRVSFDLAIPEGTTLVIPQGSSLTILEGAKLTNNGTIENNGSLSVDGEFEGSLPTGNGKTEGIQAPLDYRYYEDGAFQTGSVDNFDLITEDSAPALWNLGWYVVKGNVTISGRITVNGNIHLLLLNGCTLTAKGGIAVEGSNSLSIYAQSDGDGMGALVADGWTGDAAIGSDVTHGTTSATCGNITIHGGNIKANTASKSDGAAIGGGQGAAGGAVTIYGGVVEATSGPNSSGIGGGSGADSGTFSTGTNGTAVIRASSIADKTGKDNWKGIIFEGFSEPVSGQVFGQVYGDQTLSADLTIPEGTTLTIPANTTLTVPEGVTLTNNGTITGEGALTGKGTLEGSGTVNVGRNDFASSITATVEKNTLLYGDTLVISGRVAAQLPQTNSLTPSTANQVALFKGNTQLTEPVTVSENGEFTINYGTADKGVSIGGNTLTVKYAGGNLTASSVDLTVKLDKKSVTAQVDGAVSKTFDGQLNAGVALGIASGDLVNSTDAVTVTAPNAAYQKGDAGDNIAIDLGALAVGGNDAMWYDVQAPSGVTGSIIPAGIDGTVSINGDAVYGKTLTADYTGSANVTYQWNRGGEPISNATSKTYTLSAADIGKQITVTVTAVPGGNYTGSKTSDTVIVGKVAGSIAISCADVAYGNAPSPQVSSNTNEGAPVTYSYVGIDGTQYGPSATPPENVGTYTVTARFAETATHTAATSSPARFSITKSASTVTDAPMGVAGLVYTGDPQALVTAGTVTGGKMVYSVDGKTYSDSIPTGTDAGAYTVWYKVRGDANHTDTEAVEVTVTIAKAKPALALAATPSSLYGGGTVKLTLSGLPAGEVATVSCDNGIEVKTGADGTWTVRLPNRTRTYTFTATFAGDGNHDSAAATCTVKVTYRSSGGGSVTPRPSVSARDFSHDPSKAGPGALMPEDVIELSGAKAANAGADATLAVDRGQLRALNVAIARGETGKFDVSVSIDGGDAATVVTVTLTGRRPVPSFTDLASGSWYENAVLKAASLGYINGHEGRYRPNDGLTRAEAAAVLFNMAGGDYVYLGGYGGADTGFTDTDGSAWYASAVAWANAIGVVNGHAGRFRPNDPVTRAEFAAMLSNLHRAKGGTLGGGDLSAFPDASQVPSWAEASVSWAAANKIMGNGGFLSPNAGITRSEVAAMAVNYQPGGILADELPER